MTDFSNDKQGKILDILSLTKLASILFLGLVVIETISSKQELIFNINNSYYYFSWSTFIILVFTLVYSLWAFVLIKKLDEKKKIFALKVESLVLFTLYAITILLSGAYQSDYKVIFLFIIITSTLQLGISFGISITVFSSVFLLLMDLILAPPSSGSFYFNNDIIMCTIFFSTALPLGFYEKLRKEYIISLEDRANKDGLTGLYNHRYFYDRLEKSFNKSLLKGQEIALLFIDVDHFKEYNDSFGHQEGDQVLRQIGSILNEWNSEDISVFRYGGDEFAIIVENLDKNDAFDIGEKIRKRVEEMKFTGEEHLSYKKITTSIGIAISKDKMGSIENLIKFADDALYRAKFFNRNRVEVFSSFFEAFDIYIEDDDKELITTTKTLISIINAKDKYTYGHVERVVLYANLVAEELKLSNKEKKILIYGAYMHDIGKIGIDSYLLNKKTPLTESEWELFKAHPQDGVEIIKPLGVLNDIIPLVKYHHERYDGLGYPEGLKGEEIPFLARVLTVIDSYDAMTSVRPYKKPLTFEEGIAELKRCSGSQFDPEIVKAFECALKKFIYA